MLRLQSRKLNLVAALLVSAGIGPGCAQGEASGSGGAGAGSGTGGSGAGDGSGGELFPSGSSGSASGGGSGDACNPNLTGVIRDFKAYNYDTGEGHPDFQTFGACAMTGIVEPELGPDHKRGAERFDRSRPARRGAGDRGREGVPARPVPRRAARDRVKLPHRVVAGFHELRPDHLLSARAPERG